MDEVCRHLQAVLIERGPAALKGNAAAQEHLVACGDCFALLDALGQVDALLASPPVHDAPDALVDRVLAATAAAALLGAAPPAAAPTAAAPTPATPSPGAPATRTPGRWQRWLGAALALVLWPWRRVGRLVAALARRVGARSSLASWLRPAVLAPAGGAALLLLVVSTTGLVLTTGRLDAPMDAVSQSVAKGSPELADLGLLAPAGSVEPAERSRRAAEDRDEEPSEERRVDGELGEGRDQSGVGLRGVGAGGGRLGGAHASGGQPSPGVLSLLSGKKNEALAKVLSVDDAPPPPPAAPATPAPIVASPEPAPAAKPEPATTPRRFAVETKEKEKVGQREAQVMGALAKDQIANEIAAVRPELERVVAEEAQRNPARDGKLVVDFTIGADGRVVDARAKSSTTGNAELDRRAVDVFRRLAFPAPKGGGMVKVTYPVVFGAAGTDAASGEPGADSPARVFLAEREQIEGLTFKPATGYWANTYVPGDPAMRLLAARLERAGGGARLERGVRPNRQPFDAPAHAALAVYLDADRAGLDGPTRMLVQVGIQATERRSRARPAMNLAVVLDLRHPPSGEAAAAMRALVQALVELRDTGDRFTLVVAGRPGGVLVPNERFVHGPVLVALQQLFGERPAGGGETLDLVDATAAAFGEVVRADDPSAPLGSSTVLLVTAGRLAGELETLAALAHDGAVNGVPASVVGVGDGVDLDELDRLTLAGQGNRRLLTGAGEAAAVAEGELTAQSRIVARAVRLRLRLAPGVRLIDVLGSYRLDEARAEQVRQAEQSIDRRLSRNLGLASDRGDDEEGIQIVIPAFYAGDAHTILLDVVADGAGPIADVRLRFKDLVALRNGVARANLTLPRRQLAPGPLQLNVTKNLLARRLSEALATAGERLADGDQAGARAVLAAARELLADLARLVPGLGPDRDLARDRELLAGYVSAIGGELELAEQRQRLTDSLQLASFFKIVPRPPEP